jgi:hypothetical protein
MGRDSKTQQLTSSVLGQHLALAVAAHLARTQLIPDPLTVYDGQHMSEMVNAVANALARVAPLYVQVSGIGPPRELTPAELEGAAAQRSATVLALKDGRTLSSVSIKRADLRQAIAILKALGIPGLTPRPPKEQPAPKADGPQIGAQLAELELLLSPPLIPPQVDKAVTLAVAIARHARQGRVANLAMQLVSAVHEARSQGLAETQRVSLAIARLRAAVEEAAHPRG